MVEPLLYLLSLADKLPKPFDSLCKELLTSEEFQKAPGGATHHHNWEGGLLDHTGEVVQYALSMCKTREQEVLLTVAGIFHDRNKIFEYEIQKDGTIRNLPYRKLIGHVVGSAMYLEDALYGLGVDEDFREQIMHCLLSHHGRLEWRSPVEPQTPEAFILHSADMLSMLGGKKKETNV